MKVKDINSVNITYSDGPSLGYEEEYSKLIPIIMYDTFNTSWFLAKSQSWIDRPAGRLSGAVHQYLP